MTIPEYEQYVNAFDDPDHKCQGCDFVPTDRDTLVKHVAFKHNKLNELLQCKELVDDKRAQMKAKAKKPPKPCPICDMVDMSRDHIARYDHQLIVFIFAFCEKELTCLEGK